MTQTQMTAHLADKIGISKRQAKSTLDELNELVTRQLKKEGSLRLAGLGVFRKRKLKARVGRNPATGEQIKIPARTRLRFTPAKALKDSVLGAAATAAKAKPSGPLSAYSQRQALRIQQLGNPASRHVPRSLFDVNVPTGDADILRNG